MYDIHDTWISYELHPETPHEGILLSERFKGYDVSQMYEHLRQRGKELGIVFGNRTLLSNSRLALEASEYARDMGKYESFHENMFRFYFTEAQDIGSMDVIKSVALESGLDTEDMMKAISEKRYKLRLDEAKQEGIKIKLTGVPTFIINEKHKIVGAQPIKVFTDLFKKLPLTEVTR
jgi:predicted DsbA family dithiol-disulfide isomerase